MLGSEHWEKNFKSLLFLVKEYIVDVWEVRKQILYADHACPSHLQSQSSVGYLGGVTGVDGHRCGKLDKRGKSVNVNVHVNTCSIHFGTNSCVCSCVCCSAHGSGCVVDGGSATAAISILYKVVACLFAKVKPRNGYHMKAARVHFSSSCQ